VYRVVERTGTNVPPNGMKPTAIRSVMCRHGQLWLGLPLNHVTGFVSRCNGLSNATPDEIEAWIQRVNRKIERNLDEIIATEEMDIQGANTSSSHTELST